MATLVIATPTLGPRANCLESARVSTLPEVRDTGRVGERLDHRHSLRRPEFTAPASGLRYPLTVYAISRLFYLAIALVDLLIRGGTLAGQVANWDGRWYLLTVSVWYPHLIYHTQDTLGFFPLFPMLMWVIAQPLHAFGLHSHTIVPSLGLNVLTSYVIAGVIASLVTGAIATVLLARLAERWWGEAAGRRAILFFCLFPGTIVFSMIYTEGLLLALLAAAFLALERKRWLTAGILAGFSTAVGPTAAAIIPAFAIVSLVEIRRHGWRDPEARRSLLAPILAPAGLVAFGAYLWAWTGSPFASYTTQHAIWGWSETSSPLAIPNQVGTLISEIKVSTFSNLTIDLNIIAGLFGTVFLVYALWRLWKWRHKVGLGALLWTVGVAVLTLTSAHVPPNPRLLICAFPAVLVVGAEAQGRGQRKLLAWTAVITVAMSIGTFVGTGLRP